MKEDLDNLISRWREENLPNEARLEAILSASKLDPVMTVDWWRSVMTIPKTAFLRAA